MISDELKIAPPDPVHHPSHYTALNAEQQNFYQKLIPPSPNSSPS
ncbi:hypothetical protein [Acidipropionibacterium acidipropionici]|nr:hypothetical protein [Acidipropionibacterium acidipropionici]